MKAWIVISPVKPPEDWGFKPNKWRSSFSRVTTSRRHAREILRDLKRLEIPRIKIKQLNNLHLIT